MILARPICSQPIADLDLALVRMGLPSAAREYTLNKIPHLSVLLTGIGRDEGRFLKALAERSNAPGYEAYPTYFPGDVTTRPGTCLLTGRVEQFERLLRELGDLPQLRAALSRALGSTTPPAPTMLRGRSFEWGARTYVMGVINVTPDSFSDGGLWTSPDAAVEHGLRMASLGADIIDIGGESSRPGAQPISADEELARVLPVIRGLRARSDVPISIDTTKGAVAKVALAAGADLVNDISGLTKDPGLAKVIHDAGAACCLMHMRGTPETMQQKPEYQDVMDEVLERLGQSVADAKAAGIPQERIWVDPGIGFGKTLEHNLFILRQLQELRILGQPVVVGASRKSFLGRLTGREHPKDRLPASLSTASAMGRLGAVDVVRVHDVPETVDALRAADAIRQAKGGGALFGPRKSQSFYPGSYEPRRALG